MKASRVSRCGGLTLIEALIVLAALSVLVAMMLPQMTRRQRYHRINCINNLKMIGLSFRQWALDNDDRFPMRVSVTNGGAMEWVHQGIAWPVFQVMSNELNTPKILICPEDPDTNRYVAGNFGSLGHPGAFTNNQFLSYFVSLDADETEPDEMLVGDSDLEADGRPIPAGVPTLLTNRTVSWSVKRHKSQGNVGLADGSVTGFSNRKLRRALPGMGSATNRVIFP